MPPQPPSADDTRQTTVTSNFNPFTSNNTNPFRQETVQPEAHDTYMHGTIENRSY